MGENEISFRTSDHQSPRCIFINQAKYTFRDSDKTWYGKRQSNVQAVCYVQDNKQDLTEKTPQRGIKELIDTLRVPYIKGLWYPKVISSQLDVKEAKLTEYQLADMFTKALPEDRSYALSWKPCQGDSLNLPDHRIHKDGDGDASFQLESDSLPHAHAQTTKTYYKHQDSRIMKAQELKTKTSAQTLIYKIFLQRYQVYQGRLLASFQDDAKYEHVGQDTRSQGGKDDQDGRIKI
ncbi:hypothetical protein Tco_0349097 [Tanacetum coccineum]